MPIDVIKPGADRKAHMVRPGTEMVIREGRNPDGQKITVFSAMGICGTEATGAIVSTESAKDVTCTRCASRAERELAPPPEPQPEPAQSEPEPMVTGSHGWDAAPVLSSPEAVSEPPAEDDDDDTAESDLPTKQGIRRTPGQIRHGKIRYERAEAKRKMKAQLARG